MAATASVRVAVRVRPLSPAEQREGDCDSVVASPENRRISIGSGQNEKAFSFDSVYGTHSTSGELYEGMVAPLLHTAMQGFNVTILAYGQTGSGKTFTMMDGYTEPDNVGLANRGVAPRLMADLFSILQSGGSGQRIVDWKVRVSCLEIYQEQIYDLLSDSGASSAKNVIIRDNDKGEQVLLGLTEVPASSAAEVAKAMEKGMAARSTASTAMNARSSRSHAVFTITLEQTVSEGGGAAGGAAAAEEEAQLVKRCSRIHLVDLAGSERAKKTGAAGDRLREAASINKGLLALGNVINALAAQEDAAAAIAAGAGTGAAGEGGAAASSSSAKEPEAHIPYRDSKLTRMLKSSLGGNAHTLMIACCSPADSNLEETISTLRYASRARSIKNKAVMNTDPISQQVGELRRQVKELQEQLLLAKAGGAAGAGGLLAGAAVGMGGAAGACHTTSCSSCGQLVTLACWHAAGGGSSGTGSGGGVSGAAVNSAESNASLSTFALLPDDELFSGLAMWNASMGQDGSSRGSTRKSMDSSPSSSAAAAAELGKGAAPDASSSIAHEELQQQIASQQALLKQREQQLLAMRQRYQALKGQLQQGQEGRQRLQQEYAELAGSLCSLEERQEQSAWKLSQLASACRVALHKAAAEGQASVFFSDIQMLLGSLSEEGVEAGGSGSSAAGEGAAMPMHLELDMNIDIDLQDLETEAAQAAAAGVAAGKSTAAGKQQPATVAGKMGQLPLKQHVAPVSHSSLSLQAVPPAVNAAVVTRIAESALAEQQGSLCDAFADLNKQLKKKQEELQQVRQRGSTLAAMAAQTASLSSAAAAAAGEQRENEGSSKPSTTSSSSSSLIPTITGSAAGPAAITLQMVQELEQRMAVLHREKAELEQKLKEASAAGSTARALAAPPATAAVPAGVAAAGPAAPSSSSSSPSAATLAAQLKDYEAKIGTLQAEIRGAKRMLAVKAGNAASSSALAAEVEQLKAARSLLHKKMREETEKAKAEKQQSEAAVKGMERKLSQAANETRRLQDLLDKREQVLKAKTAEAAAAKQKLRSQQELAAIKLLTGSLSMHPMVGGAGAQTTAGVNVQALLRAQSFASAESGAGGAALLAQAVGLSTTAKQAGSSPSLLASAPAGLFSASDKQRLETSAAFSAASTLHLLSATKASLAALSGRSRSTSLKHSMLGFLNKAGAQGLLDKTEQQQKEREGQAGSSSSSGGAADATDLFPDPLQEQLEEEDAVDLQSDALLVLAEAFENQAAYRIPSQLRELLQGELAARVSLKRARANLDRLRSQRVAVVAAMAGIQQQYAAPSSSSSSSSSSSAASGYKKDAVWQQLEMQKCSLDLNISYTNNCIMALSSLLSPTSVSTGAGGAAGEGRSGRSMRTRTRQWGTEVTDVQTARRAITFLLTSAVSMAQTCDAALAELQQERQLLQGLKQEMAGLQAEAAFVKQAALEDVRRKDEEVLLTVQGLAQQLLPTLSSLKLQQEAAAGAGSGAGAGAGGASWTPLETAEGQTAFLMLHQLLQAQTGKLQELEREHDRAREAETLLLEARKELAAVRGSLSSAEESLQLSRQAEKLARMAAFAQAMVAGEGKTAGQKKMDDGAAVAAGGGGGRASSSAHQPRLSTGSTASQSSVGSSASSLSMGLLGAAAAGARGGAAGVKSARPSWQEDFHMKEGEAQDAVEEEGEEEDLIAEVLRQEQQLLAGLAAESRVRAADDMEEEEAVGAAGGRSRERAGKAGRSMAEDDDGEQEEEEEDEDSEDEEEDDDDEDYSEEEVLPKSRRALAAAAAKRPSSAASGGSSASGRGKAAATASGRRAAAAKIAAAEGEEEEAEDEELGEAEVKKATASRKARGNTAAVAKGRGSRKAPSKHAQPEEESAGEGEHAPGHASGEEQEGDEEELEDAVAKAEKKRPVKKQRPSSTAAEAGAGTGSGAGCDCSKKSMCKKSCACSKEGKHCGEACGCSHAKCQNRGGSAAREGGAGAGSSDFAAAAQALSAPEQSSAVTAPVASKVEAAGPQSQLQKPSLTTAGTVPAPAASVGAGGAGASSKPLSMGSRVGSSTLTAPPAAISGRQGVGAAAAATAAAPRLFNAAAAVAALTASTAASSVSTAARAAAPVGTAPGLASTSSSVTVAAPSSSKLGSTVSVSGGLAAVQRSLSSITSARSSGTVPAAPAAPLPSASASLSSTSTALLKDPPSLLQRKLAGQEAQTGSAGSAAGGRLAPASSSSSSMSSFSSSVAPSNLSGMKRPKPLGTGGGSENVPPPAAAPASKTTGTAAGGLAVSQSLTGTMRVGAAVSSSSSSSHPLTATVRQPLGVSSSAAGSASNQPLPPRPAFKDTMGGAGGGVAARPFLKSSGAGSTASGALGGTSRAGGFGGQSTSSSSSSSSGSGGRPLFGTGMR